MWLKRIAILTALVSSVALGTASGVLADNGTPTPVSTRVAARETAVAIRLPGELADRKARADARINGRIDLLDKLISRLQSDSSLVANDKALLLAEDQAAVAGLTALRAKIDADTTLAEIIADAKQIATYHVRDVLSPQNHELIIVDNLQTASATEAKTVADVQAQINALQAKGVNVSAMQTLLNDISSKLTTINGLLSADEKSLVAITVTTTNASATFSQVRSDATTVRSDFVAIRSDAKQIKQDVRKPSATPTP